MEGGDVGWTFVKVSEQDIPKLLCYTHVYTSLPPCDIITPTYKYNMACTDYMHGLVPSVVLLSIFIGAVRWYFERDSTEPPNFERAL